MSASSLHFSVSIISRKQGRSTVACAAYRSDEKLYDERNQRNFQFKKHEEKPESFILSPSHAPDWVNDREKLWNEVEKVEKRWTSQLSREITIALPNDLNNIQQRELIQEYVQSNFVDKGMVADVNIHRDKEHNPHAHIMLTMRPFNEDGSWGEKRSFTGELDDKGKKIYNDNPWDKRENVELWRNSYQEAVNQKYKELNLERRFDLRSYERQGREEIGTVHLGHTAAAIEEKAKEMAIKNGVEYQPVTSQGKINYDIENANKELSYYQNELAKSNAKVIELEQKKKEIENDIRRSLEKSGVWNSLSTKEKTSIMFVRNRMKEDVSLTVALKCKTQFENWEKSLTNKASNLRSEAEDINKAKIIYQDYVKAPVNTIEKDRSEIQLKRLGFSGENFSTELKNRTDSYNKNLQQYKGEREKYIENKEKVNETIRVLENVTINQAKVLYGNDQKINSYHINEIDKLVQEFKHNGNVVPLDKVDSFLAKTDQPRPLKEMSLVEQYDKFKKDNQFVVNWSRSLNKKEQEAEKIKVSNPAEYEKVKKDIEQQRAALAERLKHIKTSINVLEKSMVAKVKEQYPGENKLTNIDGKTAAKILKVNNKEQRVVPVEEFMKHLDKSNQNRSINENAHHPNANKEEFKDIDNERDNKQTQAAIMSQIANSIQGMMDDSEKGRKTNIERELNENRNRKRNQGFSR